MQGCGCLRGFGNEPRLGYQQCPIGDESEYLVVHKPCLLLGQQSEIVKLAAIAVLKINKALHYADS